MWHGRLADASFGEHGRGARATIHSPCFSRSASTLSRERFHSGNRFVAVSSIGQAPGQRGHFGNPPAVLLSLNFDDHSKFHLITSAAHAWCSDPARAPPAALRKRRPLPLLLCTLIDPSCSVTIFLATARPRPVPRFPLSNETTQTYASSSARESRCRCRSPPAPSAWPRPRICTRL
jgi:hypothetical protein